MSAYSDRILSLSPRGYWRLGASPLVDASGNGNTLAVPVAAPVAAASLLGTDPDGSRDFTDGPFYTAADSASLTLSAPLTLEAWIVPDRVSGGAGSNNILRKGAGQYDLMIGVGSVYYGYNHSGGYASVTSTAGSISVGSLYHVVVTDDGSTVRIYINGVLNRAVARPNANPATASTYPLVIGAASSTGLTGFYFFDGRIDEVAIYGTALDAATVQGNYLYGTTASSQTVPVGAVWPAGYSPHILNAWLAGQQLVGVYPTPALQFGTVGIRQVYRVGPTGVPSAQSFGTVTPKTVTARAVSGLGSAQAFGTVAPKTTVARAVAGLGSAQAFGAVTPRAAVSRSVNGVGSAQQFGTVGTKTAITKLVGGVASAQAFLAPVVVPRTTVPVSGKTSAQAFGTVTAKSVIVRAVTGVGSAQAFGTVTAKSVLVRSVSGVPSAQSFGTVTLRGAVSRAVGGVSSAQAFGTPSSRTAVTKLVGGVSSAQAFVAPLTVPRTTVPISGKTSSQAFGAVSVGGVSAVAIPGVPSARAFGAVTFTARVTKLVGGVASAQAFVAPITVPRTTVPVSGLGSGQSFGFPTVAGSAPPQVVQVGGAGSGQWFGLVSPTTSQTVLVDGVGSAQAFGQVTVKPPLLRPSDCLLVDLSPSQREERTLDPTVCTHDEPPLICGTFLCGEHILPLRYLAPAEGRTLDLRPSAADTFTLAPAAISTLTLAASGAQEIGLVAALTSELALAASVCRSDDPRLICGTFLCGERILPYRSLSPSPPQSILRFDAAEAVTLDLVPAEEF